MSLAWALRGQFGHLKGALIPGALAASMVAILLDSKAWKKAVAPSLVLGSIGFSLGGHMSYGKLVEKIVLAQNFFIPFAPGSKIFLIGALWGGLGLTFLGFGFSERPFRGSDFILFSFLALFWFVPLGIFNLERWDLFLYAFGFILLHAYNFWIKKSEIVFTFGLAGALAWGGAFLFAVLLLFLGEHHAVPKAWGWAWWSLRDQILGFAAGMGLGFAAKRLSSLSPARPRSEGLQKIGFIFYLVFIPLVNTIGVIRYWKERAGSPTAFLLYGLAICFFALLFFLLLTKGRALGSEVRLERTLILSTLGFIGYMVALATAKQTLFGGPGWEKAHTIFLIETLWLAGVLILKFLKTPGPA